MLDTAPAALTELVADGAFHLHYEARERPAAVRGEIAPRGAGDERIDREADALQVGGVTPLRLLQLTAAELPASCGVDLDGAADLDVTADLAPVLDLELDIGSRGGPNPIPEIKTFRLVASGSLDVKAKLHALAA